MGCQMEKNKNSEKTRGDKLRSALRDNLKKRKQQTRKLADISHEKLEQGTNLELRNRDFDPKANKSDNS